jgi:hypothetical protein
MCAYSLHAQKTRDAVLDETLVTYRFSTMTTGFGPADHNQGKATSHLASALNELAVCLRPGTELAFEEPVQSYVEGEMYNSSIPLKHGPEETVAVFTQTELTPFRHHDGLTLADGTFVLLNMLKPGQRARVLQLPSVVTQVAADKGATEEHDAPKAVAPIAD